MSSKSWLCLLMLMACSKPHPKGELAPGAEVPAAATASPEDKPEPRAAAGGSASPGNGAAPQAAQAVPEKTPPGPAGAPTSSAPAEQDPCATLRARYEAVKNTAPRTCASAIDCKCYSSLPFDNTIEVADKASAIKLQSLSDAYRQRRCPTVSVSTARPPQCKPRCVAAQCQ